MDAITGQTRQALIAVLQTHGHRIDLTGAVYIDGEQYGPMIHPRNLVSTFDLLSESYPKAAITFLVTTV